MVKVAVTDAELRHALNIIRSVGGDDKVTAFGRPRFSTGFFSKFTHHKQRFENYSDIDFGGFDVAYLVTDEAVEFGLKKKLKNVLLPRPKSWEIFRDKAETVKFARKVKVPVPKTWIVRRYKDDFEYPIYVKPALSSGSRGNRIIENRWEMERELPGLLERYGKLLVQEIVQKKGTIGVELIYNRGKLRGVFQHRRVREYPVGGGPSTQRVSIRSRAVREMAMKLMGGARWNGVAMVEFAITEDGPVLFEVNPRWWGSLALAVKAGVDFPRIYRDILVNGDTDAVTDYDTGIMCKYLLFGDLLHFVEKRDPVGLVGSLFEPASFDILSLSDPLPALSRLPLAVEMHADKKLKQRYLLR